MLKFRLAVIISTASAIFTIVFCLFANISLVTLIYRTLTSLIAFGLCGYLLGLVAETYAAKIQNKTKGQNIDISAVEDAYPNMEDSSFSPLTLDKFEKISSQK